MDSQPESPLFPGIVHIRRKTCKYQLHNPRQGRNNVPLKTIFRVSVSRRRREYSEAGRAGSARLVDMARIVELKSDKHIISSWYRFKLIPGPKFPH